MGIMENGNGKYENSQTHTLSYVLHTYAEVFLGYLL